MALPSALALLLVLPAGGASPPPPLFTEIAGQVGLDFVHTNGMSGELYFPEMMGSGAALFDADNDGDLDAFLVQGTTLGKGKPPAAPPRSRLYRNDLQVLPDGSRSLRFTDVTEAAKIDAKGYGNGVATGDFNNDGWTDLYLANLGPNQLLRNNGDGTFTDVTAASGTGDPRYSVSASFFDFDKDGWLDLYVANYVDWSAETNPICYAASSRRDYCGPSSFKPVPDTLYRNRGNGTFEDVSARSRIATDPQPGLGVVAFDADAYGDQDVYVANDGTPNHLWINKGDGTFEDTALLAGAAVNRAGQPEASMGVDAADFDGDGDDDLFMTHLTGETNTLYLNQGGGMFEDRTVETGAALGSLPFTSFGTLFFDYDNDGWLDLFIANGAVRILDAQAGDPLPLAEEKQLYKNVGGKLEEVSREAGPYFQIEEVSRGAAFGDVDNDGDVDILVATNNGPPRLLRNEVGSAAPWLGLRLLDRRGRDALGARVELERKGARPLVRRVHADGSYASASDPRLLFGLGGGSEVVKVTVRWPDGSVETFGPPALRTYTTLRQGPGP